MLEMEIFYMEWGVNISIALDAFIENSKTRQRKTNGFNKKRFYLERGETTASLKQGKTVAVF